MFDLHELSMSTIFLGGVAAILVASEIGRQLGMRARNKDRSNFSTLEGAVLGLLALMIGFTFAMALARFETRRDAVLSEANAIGTTALRASLLPEPQRSNILSILGDYVAVRLDVTQRPTTDAELDAAIERSSKLHERVWNEARSLAARDDRMVPTGLFIQSLNEMIDDQARRVWALRGRVPKVVFFALFGIAVIAGAFAGYGSGLPPRSSRVPVFFIAVLASAVILLILDLDRPGAGFIEVSQQPMIDTAAGISAIPR